MAKPQPGIYREGSLFHHVLEYQIDESFDPQAIRTVIADAIPQAVDQSEPRVASVVAFGSSLWQRLAPELLPEGLLEFTEIKGWGDTACPATQGDLLVWLHGQGHDDVFDAARSLHATVGTIAKLHLDQPGFTYRDSRDLTGFIDGTANPKGPAAHDAALVPAGQAGTGGAFVLSQRWVHDLPAFNRLSVADQEQVIGRTKADSVELQGDAMPETSHVSRTDVSLHGVPQNIYRRSFPYGAAAEHGLYFLAFACRVDRFAIQLDRMFGVSADDIHDRLTEFSRPVTGSYWFAPSCEALTEVFG